MYSSNPRRVGIYIIPIYGPLDGPLYTWAQYTPTVTRVATLVSIFLRIEL